MDSTVYKRIEFLGNSCGQHGSYTFYRGIRYWKDDRCHSLSIGEFFHGRLNGSDQVIPLIGELQLLWEEKNREGLKLSSVRLYILPEDCPAGRLSNHGQDEILAEDDKIVLRVEDLMRLVVLEPVVWSKGLLATHRIFPQVNLSCLNDDDDNNKEQCIYNNDDNSRSYHEDGHGSSVSSSTRVVILSYARYCRYRAALRRFEECPNRCLADFMVAAISGFATSGTTETRVMFCRSTVEHPVVENYEHRMNHLAPSLKGRRRKRRPKNKPNESEDSNESETNSEKSTLQCTSTADEDALAKRQPTQKLSELSRPKPKAKKNNSSFLTEKCFLKRLHKYMNDRGTPIVRIPILGFKEVNLFQFYQCTQQLGGYGAVTERRLWKLVYDQLGGSPGNTSAATGTRKNYEKLLLEFESHVHSRKKPVSIDGETRPVDSDKNLPVLNPPSVPPGDLETDRITGDEDSAVSDLTAPKTLDEETEKTEDKRQHPLEADLTEHSNATEMKMAIQVANGQRKLLRKTSILTCSDVKKNLNADLVGTYFPDGREEEIVDHLPSTDSDNLTISDLKPKIDAAHSGLGQKDVDQSQNNSKDSATPCTVSIEIITDKFCEKPEVNVESGFSGTVVKTEQPDSFSNKLTFIDVADKRVDEYLSSFDKISSLPALDSSCHETRNIVSCLGLSSKSPNAQQSCDSEILSVGKETGAGTKAAASTIEASSISRKLLSGGCAVVETGTLDKDSQSSSFLGLDAACMSSVVPVGVLGDELSESLSASHGFKDVVISSYAFGAVQSMTSSPSLVSGRSSFVPIDPSLSLGGTTSCSSAPSRTEQPSVLNIPIPFDRARSNDNGPRTASNRCQSAKPTAQSLAADTSPSLKRYLLSTEMKRSHSAANPPVEPTVISTKRCKGELETYGSSAERNQQMCRSSVISSPIRRFIDGTKSWIPPLDPDRTSNDAQRLSWAPPDDDQPTDLSMKTLTSRMTAPEYSQDEPLDLSKKSSVLYRGAKSNELGAKPVVLPGCSLTVPSPTVLRNGHLLSAAPTNKVAFVAPSLRRNNSSFAPATSYQMSDLYSATALASSSLPQNLNAMRTDQISPLVAFSPSFHPAFQILSTPILSTEAASGSLLGSSSTASPRLAVPFFPIIPIAQNSSSSSSSSSSLSSSFAINKVSEIGNTFLPTVLKRSSRK